LKFLKKRLKLVKRPPSITSEYVEKALADSYERLIFPSVEREVRNELTENAEEQAIKVFATNLKNLLLQPPVKGKTVLGLDPALQWWMRREKYLTLP